MKTRIDLYLALLFFFNLVFCFDVFAQGGDLSNLAFESIFFDEAVIAESTTKRDEITQESALNIKVITRSEIEIYGISTIQDLLMYIENGFEARKGRDRIYGIRGIMGYANDKIKFLIDGQEFPMMLGLGEGEFPVTLDEVKKIEIVKGPNTSLFGGNASQATINIIRFTGKDFVGVKTGIAIGSWNHKHGFFHYAEKPSDNIDYDIYFATATQGGPKLSHRDWGADYEEYMFVNDVTNPLPDHELISSLNYNDMKFMYRRVSSRRATRSPDEGVYTHNYSDAFATEIKKESLFGNENLDLIFSLEASHLGQQYDVYHNDSSIGSPIEHKAEKRLEWDAHVLYAPEDNWDLLAGISGNYWSAVGTEWGDYTTTTATTDLPSFFLATGLTSGISTPEYFPSLAEINDLADWEAWVDFKYKFNETTSMVLGGRYVYDFVPNDQLRDSDSIAKYKTDRELLKKFFPKASVVYSPLENMFLKLIYQEAFNRPNTYEQFSALNTLSMRGTLKATTARTYELVLDWVINKNMKTLVSIFRTDFFDFVNFAYTGSGWPAVDASAGEVRGFINVGDREINGIEGNFELKYATYGGFASLGYLNKNEITNVVTGLSGATGIIDDTDSNKQSFPEWNVSIGAWVKLVDNMTLSTLYSTHQNSKNNEDWTSTIYERDIDSWNIILNAKDVWRENLNIQIFVKNILNADEFKGNALDPAHREQQWPRYYEGKVTYLW
ncbi:MAG: TonB-dependent receptor plug domain-containing protein [Candidatus Aureabacteria bacterium]|nr:TonB-dependent receptor plug domain-containing protein [Candidatus Auribacterota bacterium]